MGDPRIVKEPNLSTRLILSLVSSIILPILLPLRLKGWRAGMLFKFKTLLPKTNRILLNGSAFLFCVTFIGVVASAAEAEPRLVPESQAHVRLSYASTVREVAPAVVNIYTRRRVAQRQPSFFNDPFFGRLFGEAPFGLPRERIESSLGSGVIIEAGGLIVTNHHVVKGSDEIIVVLSDRREFDAEIVGTDEATDLAVLSIQVEEHRLSFLELGDSDSLEVGDLVLAIGNPFGVGQTVTSGIVSALARTSIGLSDVGSFI